ncbi:hypothetical protein ACFSTH_01200 [Paenibacillus yanchengensis]|uniref:ABC transporter permease n=1 Tax=Paenibacillus yanchengensis TaxID=2035833 RepID=A0ABW4YEZ7_9BACL
MMEIMKVQLKPFFSRQIWLLIIICLLVGIGEGQISELSEELFVLEMMTGHHYIMYFMIPIFFLFLYRTIKQQSNIVLIRQSHFWRNFLAQVSAMFIQSFIFVMVQLLLFAVVAISLRPVNLVEQLSLTEHEVIILLNDYFATPMVAIIVVTLFMIIGFFSVSIAMLVVHHFFTERTMLIVLISLFIVMLLGYKVPALQPFVEIPLLFINNHIVFHHNLWYTGKLLVTASSTLILYVAIFVVIKYYWQSKWLRQ